MSITYAKLSLRQSLSLKTSFNIRENLMVSLKGSFWESWYVKTFVLFLKQLKNKF